MVVKNYNKCLIIQMKLQKIKKINMVFLFITIVNMMILLLLQKDLFYSIIDMFMKGNGMAHREVAKENKYGKMGLYMKGTGKIIWHMASVD